MGILDALKKAIIGGAPEPIPDIGRNEPCWCGSGDKYKNCHMAEDDKKRSSARARTCRTTT